MGQPALARSWNLSDDLGQIEYIISDKTGTLTQVGFLSCLSGKFGFTTAAEFNDIQTMFNWWQGLHWR